MVITERKKAKKLGVAMNEMNDEALQAEFEKTLDYSVNIPPQETEFIRLFL